MLKRRLKVHWTSTAGASQQYANIEGAKRSSKEPNPSDEKAKRKEVREERNKYKKG